MDRMACALGAAVHPVAGTITLTKRIYIYVLRTTDTALAFLHSQSNARRRKKVGRSKCLGRRRRWRPSTFERNYGRQWRGRSWSTPTPITSSTPTPPSPSSAASRRPTVTPSPSPLTPSPSRFHLSILYYLFVSSVVVSLLGSKNIGVPVMQARKWSCCWVLLMLVNFHVYFRLSRYRLKDLVLVPTSNASMAFFITQSVL